MRLGLPVIPGGKICTRCNGGIIRDKNGYHDTRCPTVCKQIHDKVRDLVLAKGHEAQLDVSKEDNVFNDGSEERPADILLKQGVGKNVCYDFVAVSFHDLNGMEKSRERKLNKYKAKC